MMNGRVIGGHYLDATVMPATFGSDLVLQAGFKRRKLDEEQVAKWQEVSSESSTSTISAVGQAVAGAVLPRFMSKTASAAVGATLDTTMRPPRTVRIDWADGKQSLVKLPEKLFTHLEIVLRNRRSTEPTTAAASTAEATVVTERETPPTVTEQVSSLVAGLLKDRKIASSSKSLTASQVDIAEQLVTLSSLRDSGVLTEDEFAAKKAELLSRM